MSVPSNVVKIMDPTIPVDQSIYEESTTAKARLGTRLHVGDKVFYYARLSTSANVNAGEVLCAPQIIASNQSGIAAVKTAATNSVNVVSVSVGTAVTLNQYAEGYLIAASQALAGGALCMRIKSHPAVATNTSGNFTLYDTIPGTMAAGPVNLIANAYADVKVGSEVLDIPVGVTPIAVTTGNYFWLQTYGPAAPKHSAGTPAGAAICLATEGMVGAFSVTGTLAASGFAAADYKTIIGKNTALAATATQCNPVFLTITP